MPKIPRIPQIPQSQKPKTKEAKKLEGKLEKPLTREYSLADLLKRPELSLADICEATETEIEHAQAMQQIEIAAKYSGYIDRQQEDIEKLRRNEQLLIPSVFEFSKVSGLSNEVKQKLTNARPETLGQATRVPGVTPAAVSLLLVHLKKTGLYHSIKDNNPEDKNIA